MISALVRQMPPKNTSPREPQGLTARRSDRRRSPNLRLADAVIRFALSSMIRLLPQLPVPQLPGGFFPAEALRALDVFDDLIAPARHRIIVGEASQAPADLAL